MAKQDKQAPTEGNEIKTAADLKQDGNNYRKHSDTNKARIKKSIDEAGLGRSVVVDADGVLIAGNGVQQVVDPDTPVRVIETDGTELVVVKRTDLHTDDPRRKTLALADNATSDDVEWDTAAMEANGWTEESAGEWGVDWPADEEQPQPVQGGLPPELQGVDINPDNLPKLNGDDETLMERIIIVYPKDRAAEIAQLVGLEAIDKVVYNIDELIPAIKVEEDADIQ